MDPADELARRLIDAVLATNPRGKAGEVFVDGDVLYRAAGRLLGHFLSTNSPEERDVNLAAVIVEARRQAAKGLPKNLAPLSPANAR